MSLITFCIIVFGIYLGFASHLVVNLLWYQAAPETDPVSESRKKDFCLKVFVAILWPLSLLFQRGREILVDNFFIK